MRIIVRQKPEEQPSGFTLFELVLAIAIGAMVITAIFKIADGAVQSTTQMMEYQDEDITRDAFFTFLRDHFDSLPGNAVIDLINTSNSEPFLSEMTFQNTPVSFNWGGVPVSAQATRLITVPTVTNGVDVVLEYYDVPILDSEEGPAARGIEPIVSVPLLYDVRLFEWTALDIRSYDNTDRDDWPYEWNQPNRLPGFVELKVIFRNGEKPVRRLFWIPNKANPATTMSALQNAARSARQNAGGVGGNLGGGRPGDERGERPEARPDNNGGGGRPRGSRGGRPSAGRGSRNSR